MSRVVADPSFGLSAQALAVLAMLSQSECDDLAEYDEKRRDYSVEIKTHPWYNGRERGVCLEVRPHFAARQALLVTFGEVRSSDYLFVDSWRMSEFFLNPPTVADYPDEAYQARTHVPYGEFGRAVSLIRNLIRGFILTVNAEIKATVEAPLPTSGPARILPELGEDHEQVPIERVTPPGPSPRAYVCRRDANASGTSACGEFTASFADLYKAFGKPAHTGKRNDGGDGKVSTEWIFRSTTNSEEVFTIYDYKETSLYERGLPSVRAFRALPSYDWHVGGKNEASAAGFIAWLRSQVGGL